MLMLSKLKWGWGRTRFRRHMMSGDVGVLEEMECMIVTLFGCDMCSRSRSSRRSIRSVSLCGITWKGVDILSGIFYLPDRIVLPSLLNSESGIIWCAWSCLGTVSHWMEPFPGCIWPSRYLQTRCGVVQDEWLKRLNPTALGLKQNRRRWVCSIQNWNALYIVSPVGCCVAASAKLVELKKVVGEGIRRMMRVPTVALQMVQSNSAPDPHRYMQPVAVLKYKKHETSICSFPWVDGWEGGPYVLSR